MQVAGMAVDVLVKHMEQEGIKYLFGVPGTHLLPLFDAVYRNGSIKIILTRHEAGAAYMAYGYALATGKIAACCGTVGPGATNLVTGVAAAYTDSLPMLVLAAQVGTPTFGKGACQETTGIGRTISQADLFRTVTKVSISESSGANLSASVRRAIREALSGRRGPVFIEMPPDVQIAGVQEEVLSPEAYRAPAAPATVDAASVTRAADLLLQARRPAIIAGFGASGAVASIARLANELQIPVATTLRGKGLFPEDHPLSLGTLGAFGTARANAYMFSNLDLIMALGVSFQEMTTRHWDAALQPANLIQVDLDPCEIGKNYPVAVGMVGDADAAVNAILEEIGSRKRAAPSPDVQLPEPDEDKSRSDAIPIKPQRLMRDITLEVPRNTLVFGEIGNTLAWSSRHLQRYPEGRFFAATGLAPMGAALGAAIGAKLACPDQPVVAVCGDGAFYMTGMELATAAEHSIPVVWVVMNNRRLGLIYDTQDRLFNHRRVAVELPGCDLVGVAQSLGCAAVRIERPEEIRPAIRQALASGKPTLIDAIIDQDERLPATARERTMARSAAPA